MNLEHPNTLYLRAAEGWLGLGDLVSAHGELEQIPKALQEHRDVLMMRADIFDKAKDWGALLQVAEKLSVIAPEDYYYCLQYTYALHKVGRSQEAVELLLPAVERFPEHWHVPFNLACFTTQLGRLKEARQWLETTIERCDQRTVITNALKDPDLEPLWPELMEILARPQPVTNNSKPAEPVRVVLW